MCSFYAWEKYKNLHEYLWKEGGIGGGKVGKSMTHKSPTGEGSQCHKVETWQSPTFPHPAPGGLIRVDKFISCMSSGNNNNLDCILGGTGVLQSSSDNGVTPINNSAARRTYRASYQLLQMMLVAQWSCPPAKEGQGNYKEEALARGLVYLSLMRYVCHIHALLVTWRMLASFLHPWKFIPAKIKHWRCFPQNTKI